MYPQTSTKEIEAFRQWSDELFRAARRSHDECVRVVSSGYTDGARFSIEKDGQVVSELAGSQRIGEQICGVLSTVKLADDPLLRVAHCDGVWRGSFAPFADAKGNALGLDPAFAEATNRDFEIRGRLDSLGRFVADDDKTCIGSCKPGLDWKCPNLGW